MKALFNILVRYVIIKNYTSRLWFAQYFSSSTKICLMTTLAGDDIL